MKRGFLYILVALAVLNYDSLYAQDLEADSTQFLFDGDGSFTLITTTPEDVAAKIIRVNPLVDDVVWRKSVLRVVDLRERQNNPLYYPNSDMDSLSQKNLFAIILGRVLSKELVAYAPKLGDATFVPKFLEKNKFNVEEDLINRLPDYGIMDISNSFGIINELTASIIKYYIQEVWYFNKRTSTFHSKILAIAPVSEAKYNTHYFGEETAGGTLFWVPFERLRPFLQEEFMKISGRNTAPLVNFDEFLVSRQFDSYVIKDYDLLSRDVDKGIEDPNIIRREQNRVEEEILNFEQDLWHY